MRSNDRDRILPSPGKLYECIMVLDAILEATEKTGKAIRRKLHQTGVSEVDNLSTDLLDKLREVNSISIKARIIRNNYADLYETASRFQRIMSGM